MLFKNAVPTRRTLPPGTFNGSLPIQKDVPAHISMFGVLQDKARLVGVAGLTETEKMAYVESLTRPSEQSEAKPVGKLQAASILPTYVPGQRRMVYAGVGARDTPEKVLTLMRRVASRLDAQGYSLQTGDAIGADSAFASGSTRHQIFTAKDADERSVAIAKEIHPAPKFLPAHILRLMARNAFQVFGRDLDAPVDFLLCWTEDGCESIETRKRDTGGTGQAIALASLRGIPVINMKNKGWAERVRAIVEQLN